ncbi:MAG TPA: AfsR family transcriptional regulator, partial [Micromonosporaceae bacterium]|nr:AfsR family transcriptional regulator [Micromonosporaceae bacterium]
CALPISLMVRRLLAALLSRAGELVPVEELILVLWGEDAPPSARKTLQVYVRRLRSALGEDQRIVHEPAGYRIRVTEDELDSAQFAQLVAAGCRERTPDLLKEALGLWRGAAFEDVREHSPLLDEARRLDEERLRVEAEWVGLQLELGRHDEVIPHLAKLTEAHPFREDLRGHLMPALYRAGRQAEGLELFRCTRKLLDDELGISPGPALSRLHESILCASPELDLAPTTSIVPRELPADVGGFVGRTAQLQTLDAMIPDSSPVVISAIAGTAGVGKTALAVHWARRVASRFPDGQLYLNLNGFSSSAPIRPIEALASMLRSVGVPSEKVPMEEADAAALFRSTVAARQMLIVLDNARSADQVRPLLPGSNGCLVLVTSRNNLSGLVAREGARRLDLDVLSPGEARDLLARILGDARVRAEPSAVDDLAQACAYLPLALRVAAANLNDQPHRTVAAHVDELRSGNRLASLAVEDDDQAAVRSAFDLSYHDIEAPVRSTFRLLGLVPGRDFTIDAVAAMAGLSHLEASRHLVRLSNAHLIEQAAPERYTFHDLLRLYASECAHAEDGESSRTSALQRLFDWYIHTVEAAAKQLYANLVRLPVPPAGEAATPVSFEGPAAATAWLDSERLNIIFTIHYAAEFGPSEAAWLLASGMRGYFARRRHMVDWLPAATVALAATESAGDARAQAVAHLVVAHASQAQYAHQQAIDHLQAAAALAEDVSWPQLRATCIGNLGGLYYEMGSMDKAVAVVRQSLELSRDVGHLNGEAQALSNLGLLLTRCGQLDEAHELLQEALRLYGQKGAAATPLSIALTQLADVLRLRGDLGQADAFLRQALVVMRSVAGGDAFMLEMQAEIYLDGGLYKEAMELALAARLGAVRVSDTQVESESLVVIGTLHANAGEFGAALVQHSAALAIARRDGIRYAENRAVLGVAHAHWGRGFHDLAHDAAIEGLQSARNYGFAVLEGQALTLLGRIASNRQQSGEALDSAEKALENHRRTGYRLGEADTLTLLAELVADLDTALAHRHTAEEIYIGVRSTVRKEFSA